MRRLALIAVLMLVAAGSTAQTRVIGYHAWWMQNGWERYDLSLYDKILFFEIGVEADGRLGDRHGWPDAWADLIERASATDTRIVPTFAILDPAVFSAMLSSRAARSRFADAVMAVTETSDGAHLNFETFEPSGEAARNGLTDLVVELAGRIRSRDPQDELTVFLPGFDHGESFDEAALAAAADYVVVQGYDMHWLNGPTAGPVAPLRGWSGASWEGITDRYAALGVDPARTLLAVPYYGYEWPTVSALPGADTRGEGIAMTYAPVDSVRLPLIRKVATLEADRYGAQRDPVSDSPYYTVRRGDGWYQGWFEDARSLAAKYRFVRERGLGGVAVFLLGYDAERLEGELARLRGR